VEATLLGVLEAVGIKESASIQILRVARDALLKRFDELSLRERLEQRNEIPLDEINLDGLEEEIESERIRVKRENLLRLHERESRNHRGQPVFPARADLPTNSVTNLGSLVPSQNIRPEIIESSLQAEGVWLLPSSRNSSTRHTVSLTGDGQESQSLACTCRGFRSHHHCYHTINIARFLGIRRIVEEQI